MVAEPGPRQNFWTRLRAHLDICGTDNAPLLIILGSHKLGRIPVADIETVVSQDPAFACLAGAGDVWIYASSIVHASNATESPTTPGFCKLITQTPSFLLA